MSAQHTPTPWQLDPCHSANGFRAIRRTDGSEHGDTEAPVIATGYTDADAAFIVRAVNSHADLVEELERAYEYLAHQDAQELCPEALIERIGCTLAAARGEG